MLDLRLANQLGELIHFGVLGGQSALELGHLFVGAVLLGLGLLYFGARLAFLNLPLSSAASKMRARHVLQATVIYLPLLFALMMGNSAML